MADGLSLWRRPALWSLFLAPWTTHRTAIQLPVLVLLRMMLLTSTGSLLVALWFPLLSPAPGLPLLVLVLGALPALLAWLLLTISVLWLALSRLLLPASAPLLLALLILCLVLLTRGWSPPPAAARLPFLPLFGVGALPDLISTLAARLILLRLLGLLIVRVRPASPPTVSASLRPLLASRFAVLLVVLIVQKILLLRWQQDRRGGLGESGIDRVHA